MKNGRAHWDRVTLENIRCKLPCLTKNYCIFSVLYRFNLCVCICGRGEGV